MSNETKKYQIIYIFMHIFFWISYLISWGYTAVYLSHRGQSSTTIGLITGIGAIISVIVQPLLISYIERSLWLDIKKLIIGLKILALTFAVIIHLIPSNGIILILLFTLVCMLDVSITSMYNSICMDTVNRGININFGLGRGSGSLFYAISSIVFGYLVKDFGPAVLMPLYISFSILAIIAVIVFPYVKPAASTSRDNFKANSHEDNENSDLNIKKGNGLFSRYPFLMPFLIATVLIFMGHSMFNMFLIKVIERAGGDSSSMGIALAIAAGTELPVMTITAKLSKKLTTTRLLMISALFFTFKMLLSFFASNMAILFIAQFMQCGAFAVYTPVAVYYINEKLDEKDKAMGQSLNGAFSLGLGGAVGNIIGGVIVDCFGVPAMILFSAGLSFAGFISLIIASKKEKN